MKRRIIRVVQDNYAIQGNCLRLISNFTSINPFILTFINTRNVVYFSCFVLTNVAPYK